MNYRKLFITLFASLALGLVFGVSVPKADAEIPYRITIKGYAYNVAVDIPKFLVIPPQINKNDDGSIDLPMVLYIGPTTITENNLSGWRFIHTLYEIIGQEDAKEYAPARTIAGKIITKITEISGPTVVPAPGTVTSYTREDDGFLVLDFANLISDKASIIIDDSEDTFDDWISGTVGDTMQPASIRLPFDPLPSMRITSDNLDGWFAINDFYNKIVQNPRNDQDKSDAEKAHTTIQEQIDEYMNPSTPDASDPIKLTVTPRTLTLEPKPTSTEIKVELTGNNSGKYCYLYVGSGAGVYHLKASGAVASINDAAGECLFSWTPNTTTSIGKHTIVVTVQDLDWAQSDDKQDTYSADQDLPTPFRSMAINVCQTKGNSCEEIEDGAGMGTFRVSPRAVTLGGSTKPEFKFYIYDPNRAQTAKNDGAKCFVYLKKNSEWVLKKSLDIRGSEANHVNEPNCSWEWDFSGTAPGIYPFIMVPLERTPEQLTKLENEKYVASVTVCAAGSTECKATEEDDEDTGEAEAKTITGKFSSVISGAAVTAHLKPNFKDFESVFRSILSLASLVGIMAFIAVVFGGLQIIMAAGDPAKMAKGKKSIFYGLLAIFVAVISYFYIAMFVTGTNALLK